MPFFSFPSIRPTPPLYPQIPCTNYIARLPPFSETLPISIFSELVRNYPFKSKASEDSEAKPLISCTHWTKAELRATVKDFPKVTKNHHRFAEELNINI